MKQNKLANPVLPPPTTEAFVEPELSGRLVNQFGDPWELSEGNEIIALNREWWAGLFRAKNHVLHDPVERQFFTYDTIQGIYGEESHWSLHVRLSRLLLEASRTADLPALAMPKHRSLRGQKEMVEHLRGIADAPDPFKPTSLLALENGIVELTPKGIRFHNFSPKFRLRWKAAVPYDDTARCPLFQSEFLASMLPDEADRDLLLQQAGLMLLGLNPAQRMAILEGDSSAGKTSFANILISLVGETNAIQLRTEHLEKQFELESLRGRKLLLGIDVGERFLVTPGAQTLKGLVSTDLYHPEGKNRINRLPLRGPFNVLVGTNCKLTHRSQGDAPAWRRRLVIYACEKPENRKRITDFDQVLLKKEGPGIVNLLLEGARRALADINRIGDLVLNDAQLARVDALVLRSDPLEAFVTGCLVEDDDANVSSDELAAAYLVFCRERKWRPRPDQEFREKVCTAIAERFGIPRTKHIKRVVEGQTKDVVGWHCLRLQVEEWRPTE